MDDGHRPVKAWALGLQKVELGKLNQKLDMLGRNGADLPPGLLAGTNDRNVDKIRINGHVALRVLLCRGPIKVDGSEFTLLHACFERDGQLPANSVETAAQRRTDILNGNLKRAIYERYKR